jgi:26S proteasome regulatory subunit (ATPase 3-interacting protein)
LSNSFYGFYSQFLLRFPKQQNRPFSVQNFVDNLKGKVKKAAAQKALDSLAEGQLIAVKELGKAKVYYANQDQFDVPSKDEILEMDQRISDAQTELLALETQKKAMESGSLPHPSPLFVSKIPPRKCSFGFRINQRRTC